MTNTQHAEVSLWEHARGGDAQAFGAIFDLHHARIHRQARRLTSSPLDADDVTIPDPGVAPTTPTVAEFQAAVTAAGFGCTTLEPLPEGPPGMTSGATCLPSGLRIMLFASPADAARVLALNAGSLEPARFLAGPDWIVAPSDVTGSSDDLIALQSHLGGALTW